MSVRTRSGIRADLGSRRDGAVRRPEYESQIFGRRAPGGNRHDAIGRRPDTNTGATRPDQLGLRGAKTGARTSAMRSGTLMCWPRMNASASATN